MTETYWQLVTNLPHVGAEITWDIVLDIVALPYVLVWRNRHDKRVHGIGATSKASREGPTSARSIRWWD